MNNQQNVETILRIVRRLPDSRDTRKALAMLKAGELPSVELLRRIGATRGMVAL